MDSCEGRCGTDTLLLTAFAFFWLFLSTFQGGLAAEDLWKNYALNRVVIAVSLVSVFVVAIDALGIITLSILLPSYYILWPKRRKYYLDNEP